MIHAIERCNVCGRPPANRIVLRKSNLLICSRECAKDSIGLDEWNKFFDQECRSRMKRNPQAIQWRLDELQSNVIPVAKALERKEMA